MCFVVWTAFNVHDEIHVLEKNHLLQSTICALENSKAIPILIFTWSWSIIHPDLLFEPKRNLKGGGSGLVKICKARRSSRERFCEQSTRAETLKMAAHTQTLTKSDCLNHTEKDRILYEVSDGKVNSVKEGWAKCFAVHILEFEMFANAYYLYWRILIDLFMMLYIALLVLHSAVTG